MATVITTIRPSTRDTNACVVLPPVETTGLKSTDVDDLAARVRKDMEAELVKVTEIARGQGTALASSDTHLQEGKKTA